MRQKLGHFLLILPSLIWVMAVLKYEGLFSFINLALAALFHECGHLMAFSILGLPSPRITPVARGVRFVAPVGISYRQELVIAAAGPLSNLAVFILGSIWHGRFPILAAFGEVNLITAICNLVPMADLDGERILRCTLSPFCSDRTLFCTMETVSYITTVTGLLFSLVYYWYTGGGIYPGMLCLAALLTRGSGKRKQEQKRDKER